MGVAKKLLDLAVKAAREAEAAPLAVRGAARVAPATEPALQAAVRVAGKVYKAPTHLGALEMIADPNVRRAASSDASNRGFVNERGRFLDRYKAADYARNFGLFAPTAPSWAQSAPELISENLRTPKRRGGLAVKRRARAK